VFDALEAIARERTLVMIAHRLEPVAKADNVLLLDAGRVIDAGQAGCVLGRYLAGGRGLNGHGEDLLNARAI
jgi:ATP-binding cassette, subfamily B, bacterial IrtB/YbtQ